jgi:hydroxypyruvate reductase
MTEAAWPRDDLAAIRDALLAASRPESLVVRRLAVAGGEVLLDDRPFAPPLAVGRGRLVIVGGGKAAAGMAAGLVQVLAAGGIAAERITGLVSVPQGSGRRLPGVEVRETRPAAENLPTPAAVAATREMLDLVTSLGPEDLAVALVSGGGSALVAAPREGVPLEDKIAVTRRLSAAGADITALNVVRQAASDVKGGGLARACSAGRLLVLVLSDVTGDPLEFIASGPCVPLVATAAAALAVLERFAATDVAPRLTAVLRAEKARGVAEQRPAVAASMASWTTPRGCRVDHVLVGTNATAVAAAARAAERLGYAVTIRPASAGLPETADEVGRRLAREGRALAAATAADGRARAIVEGGEAVVRLPADHGRGGRNQQTVAAALDEAIQSGGWPQGLIVASIGTDGEDGPTAAAGGLADAGVAARIRELGLDVADAVARCDAQPLLEAAGGLVVTGPTGTNVADVRIVLARGASASPASRRL